MNTLKQHLDSFDKEFDKEFNTANTFLVFKHLKGDEEIYGANAVGFVKDFFITYNRTALEMLKKEIEAIPNTDTQRESDAYMEGNDMETKTCEHEFKYSHSEAKPCSGTTASYYTQDVVICTRCGEIRRQKYGTQP